jgi:putative copper resistance protein D
MTIYEQHCARCHGTAGAGDGPEASRLAYPPADLGSAHTGAHTAGDLFWWITEGRPGRGMPAFCDRLGETERWDVINFVRALQAAPMVRALGSSVDPERPRIVAPDFSFSVGPGQPRSLRDQRGRRIVLVVIYSVPGSRARLGRLAEQASLLGMLGVEVIGVPRDASPDAIRDLGPEPRVLFPIVTEGAAEIVATYGRFVPAPHAEFLVDRRGYLRAVFPGNEDSADAANRVLAEVQQLNEERADAPPADEHVH